MGNVEMWSLFVSKYDQWIFLNTLYVRYNARKITYTIIMLIIRSVLILFLIIYQSEWLTNTILDMGHLKCASPFQKLQLHKIIMEQSHFTVHLMCSIITLQIGLNGHFILKLVCLYSPLHVFSILLLWPFDLLTIDVSLEMMKHLYLCPSRR